MIPKVEIEAGKADLIREILGVNDLQDINLLDEYRDIFIKSQKSAYENVHSKKLYYYQPSRLLCLPL